MHSDDPRLRPGVLIRARMDRNDEHDGDEVIGYLMDPNSKVPGFSADGWPRGYSWGLIAKQSVVNSREVFWGNDVQNPISEAEFSKVFDSPVGSVWLFCCFFSTMEYLGEGFAGPPKSKHRRGKRHCMRSTL